MKTFKSKLLWAGILLLLSGSAVMAASGKTSIPNAAPPVKYQAVLRDDRGYVRADETLNLTLDLRQNGTTVYKETHSVTTDALGQVQLYLGEGTPLAGRYHDAMDWSQETELKVSEGNKELATVPVTAVPRAIYAHRAEQAQSSTMAISAENATYAATAETATTAQQLEDKLFNDERDPAANIYYSSEKITRMIQGQTGQTALAKEVAERKAEDLRILDSLLMETVRRMAEDQRLWDSLANIRKASDLELSHLLDSLVAERRRRIEGDAALQTGLDGLSEALAQESTDRAEEDQRIWDSIGKVSDKEQNVCDATDHKRGIYTAPIPVYDVDAPTEKGLFVMPELKVLQQSASCDLFELSAVSRLDHSFKTRVMAYNATGNSSTPTSVMIPAGNADADVYVDNFLISSPAEYLTYDVLVFDVEYYYMPDGKGKMYVTLVRE